MTITLGDIRPGDVLLFHGSSFISWAIRKLDGTRVNHAAIALGEGELGEAAGSGLRRASVAQTVKGNKFTVVRRLPEQDLAPVLTKANSYLDGRVPYAYQQIVLLALLTTTRRIPMPGSARRLVRSVLDHAAAALNAMVDSGAKTMICSEYVYRCYDEAADISPDPYALDILRRYVEAAFGAADLLPGVEEASLLSWALAQPPAAIEAAGSISFAAPPIAAHPDELEDLLAPVILEYAQRVSPEDPEVQALGPPSFGPPTAATGPEPTDVELLASMTLFSAALERHQEEAARMEFGIGDEVAKGALRGLLHVSADPNFVTPGDLVNSASLDDVGEI